MSLILSTTFCTIWSGPKLFVKVSHVFISPLRSSENYTSYTGIHMCINLCIFRTTTVCLLVSSALLDGSFQKVRLLHNPLSIRTRSVKQSTKTQAFRNLEYRKRLQTWWFYWQWSEVRWNIHCEGLRAPRKNNRSIVLTVIHTFRAVIEQLSLAFVQWSKIIYAFW